MSMNASRRQMNATRYATTPLEGMTVVVKMATPSTTLATLVCKIHSLLKLADFLGVHKAANVELTHRLAPRSWNVSVLLATTTPQKMEPSAGTVTSARIAFAASSASTLTGVSPVPVTAVSTWQMIESPASPVLH